MTIPPDRMRIRLEASITTPGRLDAPRGGVDLIFGVSWPRMKNVHASSPTRPRTVRTSVITPVGEHPVQGESAGCVVVSLESIGRFGFGGAAFTRDDSSG